MHFLLCSTLVKLQRKNPITQFALLLMFVMWSDQDRLLLIVTPRYFACWTSQMLANALNEILKTDNVLFIRHS